VNRISFMAPRLERLDELPPGGLLVFFLFGERAPLAGAASLVDWRLHGHLSRLVIDGFIAGAAGEAVLVPLGRRLPQEHLVLLGLGPRAAFDASGFDQALARMFRTADGLGFGSIILAMPGRPELACDTTDAIERFLATYDRLGDDRPIHIIEPSGAQKAMIPAVERWRMKRAVPQATEGDEARS